jgi:hypothetical protein
MGALGWVMAPNVATRNSIQQDPIGRFGKAPFKEKDMDGRERRQVDVLCAKQTVCPAMTKGWIIGARF